MSLLVTLGRATTLALLIATAPAMAELTPEDPQRIAAQEIAESLQTGHYVEISLDNEWSRDAFQRYLDVLDNQRYYLTAADIEEFNDLSTSMDEAVTEGKLDRAYALYNRYQQRATEQLEWTLARIDEGLDFSFDSDLRLEVDRKDAPWLRNREALEALWMKRLENAALSLTLSEQEPEEVEETLRKRYKAQLKRVRQTNPEDVLEYLMAAVTATIDPHTSYLSPRQSEAFNIQMRLSLEGIGAMLQPDGEFVKVVSLVPGGPADRSGMLEPADRIIGVGPLGEDVTNVVGMRLDEVVEMIRGPKGTVVQLDIVPSQAADLSQSKVIEITRDTVKLEDQAVNSEVIDIEREDGVHKVGLIHVPTFYVDFDAWQAGEEDYRSTTRDVAAEIDSLREQGIEGIVLDLRNNGGGALQEANSLIGLFIDRGPTVQVRDARGRISLYGDTESGTYYDGPLAVLVNRLSASASEIFAGAIQDYRRGLVVGTETFGKGTVQTLSDLTHGQVKLTRAKFYRISGESTQNRGITPDILFPSLVDPEKIGESSLDNALPWDTVRKVQYRQQGEPQLYLDMLRKQHTKRAQEHPNFYYLERRAELAERLRQQRTTVSLNLEQRKREVEAQDAEQLALENARRSALGLELLEDWSDRRNKNKDDESQDTDSDEDSEKKDQPIDRAQVEETAEILLDYARLSNKVQFADHSTEEQQ
ncbi:carboxy terminal-processing peptidase [Halomonas halocynthiae]|uniref:carboxy terminal-processing peptidase n=1 Tax=Halomonas halocynthiae TaxID=176290 RepID=UPI000403D120|nr:carboxy terminal-processing peptidase [Halomonas halocynthiae]